MIFPITREQIWVLDRIEHLAERETEAQSMLECIRIERDQVIEHLRLRTATTGNLALDFALVVCRGVFDKSVVDQYQRLEMDLKRAEHGMQKHPPILLTVQSARYVYNHELVQIRCIHIGTVTGRKILYDLMSELIEIPVEEKFYIRSEIVNTHTGRVTSHDGIREGGWLTVGPLKNRRCHDPVATRDGVECRVPYGAVVSYALSPFNPEQLHAMDMDNELVRDCMAQWVRQKTLRIK